jgi:alpha-1,6-mannosyltransferase
LAMLARKRDSLPEETPRLLFRWAILFGAASLLTTPLFVHDFWLSIGWGRMMLAGSNPYYHALTIEFARGLPLDYLNLRMTYGPLWALVSAVLTGMAGGNGFLAAVFFKLALLGAWIGALRLIWKMLAKYSLWRQCVAIAIFGWLPLSVVETIGDGHNDIVMVFFMLLWLFSLQRGGKLSASLALAASILIKYTTVPLFLLDFLYARYSQKQSLLRYAPRLIAAGALNVIVIGLFYRSRDFFEATARMQDWHFFEPREAIISFSKLLRIPVHIRAGLVWSIIILFVSITIYFVVRFVRESTEQALWVTVTAIMATVIFCIVGHVWPWFLIWVLAPAALVPGSAIARWALGVALVAPFSFFMLQFPNFGQYVLWEVTVMTLYVFSVVWLLLAPKKWFPEGELKEQGAATSAYAFESLKT